jgi:TonB-linked SusC/RagA family outer membrane protein
MRKKIFYVWLLLAIASGAIAQNNQVTGKITDEKGVPITGASVVEKKTKKGTSTGIDGNFTLSVPAGSTLIVSYVGFEKKEIAAGNSQSLNIALKPLSQSLSEVVVTALGIKREKKALGYSITTVGSKDIELRPEGDIGRVLSGKVAGLDILNSSGISGSGTNISIRGISTITGGASTPLFIVDGVPFDGGNNNDLNFQIGAGISSSSRFLDLDPNNIESVNVLKGLSATTLYGEAARNGVILVTTKNGSSRKTSKKLEITASQSLFANTVANLPVYQNDYGGGFDLVPSSAFSNWGAKFTNPPLQLPYSAPLIAAYPEYGTKKQDYKAYNSVPAFFRTGIVKTTSLNIASSGTNTTFNANYTYMDDEGFTPNNRVYKNNFGMGGTAKLANNFTLNGVLNFAITDFQTPIIGANSAGGTADVASVFSALLFTPRSVDLMGLPYQDPITGGSIYYRPGNDIQNPRWTAQNALSGDVTYRTYGTLGVKYDIMKGLSVNYRFGLDLYQEQQTLEVNKGGVEGGPGYVNGLYRTTNIYNNILNNTLNVNYNTNLGSSFNLTVDAGADMRHDLYTQSGLKSTQQIVFGLFDHSNFISHDIVSEDGIDLDGKTEERRAGVYAQAVLGYKDYAYLTLNGRNDWVSTLEKNNRRLFYPGVSLSFIPTSYIESLKNSNAVNYLKLRVGYSTSAHFPVPYQTRSSLIIITNQFIAANGNVGNIAAIPNNIANPDLKPELLKEVEGGVEGKFFDNRISLDLTGYFRTASNQILSRQLDGSTGSTTTTINAGAVDNKGIEVALGYVVVRSKDWRWELNGVFTLNRSRVHDMPADIKQILISGFSNSGLGTYAINGKPLGILQGSYVQLDTGANSHSTGKKIVDNNGYYLASAGIAIIGDPNPAYKLTGISTLSYKAFSFRMQWDYTHGGQVYSNTVRTLLSRGVTKDTDFDRTLPYILPNTVKQDGTPNDYQQSVDNTYFNSYGFGPQSVGIYDATLIRLREVSISYSLPASVLKKTPFGAASFTISGNNVWYLAPNFPKYTRFDPESNSLGVSNSKGFDFQTGPSSRRIGASIRVSF